jgi:hypothetical protein
MTFWISTEKDWCKRGSARSHRVSSEPGFMTAVGDGSDASGLAGEALAGLLDRNP